MKLLPYLRLRWYDGCPELLAQRDADVFVISYPKSGRTWLRLMLGKYLADRAGIEFSELLETYDLTRAIPAVPRIAVVHDGSCTSGINWKAGRLATNKRRYRDKKVVFLARDPRDTVVSYYFHCCRRLKVYDGQLRDFIRDPSFGLPKIIHFLNIWAENRHVPRAFLLMRYEDLHRDPAAGLMKFLEFIGVKCEPAGVDAAVKYAGFENMREMELQGKFGSDRLRPGDKTDRESYKTRKGKVGSHAEYLSGDDLEDANELIRKELSPIFGYERSAGVTA